MKKKILISVGIIAVVILVVLAFIHQKIKAYEKVAQLPITMVDLTTIEDGTYEGSFTYAGRIVTVNVMVQNESISKVEILKKDKSSYTANAAEQLPKLIVAKQNNSIDAVSGATTSSKAILKAVENALIPTK